MGNTFFVFWMDIFLHHVLCFRCKTNYFYPRDFFGFVPRMAASTLNRVVLIVSLYHIIRHLYSRYFTKPLSRLYHVWNNPRYFCLQSSENINLFAVQNFCSLWVSINILRFSLAFELQIGLCTADLLTLGTYGPSELITSPCYIRTLSTCTLMNVVPMRKLDICSCGKGNVAASIPIDFLYKGKKL